MRKICLALCISLFTSIIHAGVMPIDILNLEPHHQSISIDTDARL